MSDEGERNGLAQTDLTQLFRHLEVRPHLAYALIVPALLLGAWNRFVQDDAFITFRYSAHLAAGHGPVWNVGEAPVEGYTNFLWMLLLAVPELLGLSAVHSSQWFGLACGGVTVAATLRLGQELAGSVRLACVAAVLLATNYTFSAFMTGGLETQLQTTLFVVGSLCVVRFVQTASLVTGLALSLIAAAAVMTRLDSGLPIGLLYAFVVFERRSWLPRIDVGREWSRWTVLILPALLLVAGWLWWKLTFYGDVLPNTFYVKTGSGSSPAAGLYYVATFFISYGLVAAPLLVLLPQRARPPRLRYAIGLGLLCVSWVAYVARVGGDFMEFRFMVPILPWLYLLIARQVATLRSERLRFGVISLLILCSILHAQRFSASRGIESVAQLEGHVEGWTRIGKRLGELFADAAPGDEVRLAVTAAGAVPYFSGLPSVDMHGLNDAWLPANGITIDARVGHSLHAPLSYLVEREVHLVIGHPRILDRAQASSTSPLGYLSTPQALDLLPETALIVELALDQDSRTKSNSRTSANC